MDVRRYVWSGAAGAWMVLVLMVFIASGCGTVDVMLGRVVGRVTLDGVPVPGAWVTFTPEQGRVSSAFSDDEGRYELSFTINRKGALVGRHAVSISWRPPESPDDDGQAGRKRSAGGPSFVIPERYNTATTLSAEVRPGRNSIDFELLSK